MFLRILACVLIVMFVGVIVPSQADANKIRDILIGWGIDKAKDAVVNKAKEVAEAVEDGVDWVRDTFGMDSGTCGGEAWCDGCGTPITLYFNSGSCCDPCMGYFD